MDERSGAVRRPAVAADDAEADGSSASPADEAGGPSPAQHRKNLAEMNAKTNARKIEPQTDEPQKKKPFGVAPRRRTDDSAVAG